MAWTSGCVAGASGSSTSSASRAPSGAPVQVSGGEVPSPSAVKRSGSRAPSAKAGLDRRSVPKRQRARASQAGLRRHQLVHAGAPVRQQATEPGGNVFEHRGPPWANNGSTSGRLPVGTGMARAGCPAMEHDLQRFVTAQADSYAVALTELRRGRKASHWMWWVFPQIAGLGRSPTAQHYAIGSTDEAAAYLRHPLLGPRLVEATQVVTAAAGSADAILGTVDAIKLRSSMTLFETVADDPAPFRAALDRFFGGERDAATVALLRRSPTPPVD